MFVKTAVLALMGIWSSVTDFKYMKIYNVQIVLFLITDIIFAILGLTEITAVLLGAALPLVLLPLFFINKTGAGDIKLLCAMGGLYGPQFSLYTMAFSFISGGIIAAVYLILGKLRKNNYKNKRICFAPMIFAGAIMAYIKVFAPF